MTKSKLELAFIGVIKLHGLPLPVAEYKFHPSRKWRFDFAYPNDFIAIEIEGGIWLPKGRHTTGVGFSADCEKFNEAALLGWRILKFTPEMIKSHKCAHYVQEILASSREKAEGTD